MSEVTMLLDDPELARRGPGEEFALAHARMGEKASVTLRASISDLFPPAQRRPRYTVRHLLRKAVLDGDAATVFRERAADVADGTAAPEWDFQVGITTAQVQTIHAAVSVPPEVLADPAALAAFVDFRLLVRLGTAENDVLLNGDGSEGILGLLRTPGIRTADAPAATVAETLLRTAALCEWYGGSADGIVMHPDDWWPLLSDGALLDRLTAAGVRISRTRMVPAGSALVGDFTAAATLLDRRTSTIRMAREGDLPVPGAGVVAEIQEAFAVHLPGHFVLARLPDGHRTGAGA
ncbi:MAG: family 3 encapsulin nanocompartment shell protein [Actinocatenispora sp.]